MNLTLLTAAIAITSICAAAHCPQAPVTISSVRTVADTVNLADYVGTFKAPAGGQIDMATIELKDGRLYATAAGITTELNATSTADVYTENSYGAVITFIRDEKKVVTKLQLVVDQMQMNVTMLKQ